MHTYWSPTLETQPIQGSTQLDLWTLRKDNTGVIIKDLVTGYTSHPEYMYTHLEQKVLELVLSNGFREGYM